MSSKTAATDYPIHPLLAERWSPRAFQDRSVDPTMLATLFEAARWAASCFNQQPWRFIYAHRSQTAAFEKLASCLVEGNRWAKKAPVLVLAVTKTHFDHNNKPNRHSAHDVGLALGNFTLQAEALGLSLHQMAGFSVETAREVFGISEAYQPMTMVALGYRGDPDQLEDEKLRERELAPRERRPLSEIVYEGEWREV